MLLLGANTGRCVVDSIYRLPRLTVLGGGGIYSVHGSPRRSDGKPMHGLLTNKEIE